jgi:hypothetical protein
MHSPCCTCGSCPTYSSDTFSSTLDPKWTVDSGSWSVSSNKLVGSGAGLIYDTTADPNGAGQDVALTLRYAFTASGGATNTFRFLVSLFDASNYLYAEVSREPTSGHTTLQLGEVVSGADNPLGDPVPLEPSVSLNTFRTIKICYYAATERLRATAAAGFGDGYGAEVDATGIGDKIGLAIVTGDGEFDDIVFSQSYDTDHTNCPHCNTSDCFIGDHSLSGSIDTFLWATITGSWGSNYTPSGDSILKYLRPHPLHKGTMHLKLRATVAAGETVRGYVNYKDASNHLYAEAGWDSTTVFRLSLFSVSAGTPTTLDERFVTLAGATSFDKNIRLTVCYDGSSISAEAFNESTIEILHASSAATEITDGVWCAIGSNGGPTFFDFEFEKYYSTVDVGDDDCPVCPTACGCHASHVPRGNYTVDFGAGGWTDGGCDYCDQVAGDFILGEWTDGVECTANYIDHEVCDYSTCAGGGNNINGLIIRLSLISAGGGQLKWRLDVALGPIVITDPSCPDNDAVARYESDPFDTDECDVVPVTLSKVSDVISADLCGGSLPSTISIDET